MTLGNSVERRGPRKMSILSMSTLLAKSAPDLVEIVVLHATAAQSHAVSAAKGIIALVAVTGSETEARSVLKKAKVSDCTVKNAMQLVWCYDAVVTPGHASEAWFDQLLYAHAVEVRRAIAKVGIAKVCDAKLFAKSAKTNMIEFELLADTGLNREERIADAQAKADADIATTAKVAKEKTVAKDEPAPGAVAALEKPAEGKAKKSVLSEFETLLKGAEAFIGIVIPTADEVTVEAMKARVAGLMVVMQAAVEARATALKKLAA